MIFKALRSDANVDDSTFNDLYPPDIKELAQRHWTPVDVAKMAANYLVQHPNDKVLDIGAGAGKFCLVGAACTEGMFYGVEQRESLVEISNEIAQKHQIDNVEFIHANIDQISFSDYDSFYFYNSFYENMDTSSPIDHSILPDQELYYSYTEYLRKQLKQMPVGTRIVSYWSGWEEIPTSFDLDKTACSGLLNFWRKII
ncbi:SAM-dependent methyltransferase [Sphingobacterium sp. ML3W]|uniref:methyltransferase domain-containing protein n=1 Tax=Sphingobacterium TaxID=28453 RepID=UPI0004F76EFC|nr:MULTISPECIES: methyltransferase domain-containing protein [Sphingobacterium]AIM36864.1 SAM-dependent methyltransferase [Sphingobacterium sp. ML3W]MDH5826979.1 methyltransferase domain-containing protein [Sphingobacterium faecium]